MSSGGIIAKNSAWLLIDNVAGVLVTLFTSVMIARTLGPERYGSLQYVLWAAAMARLVGEMGVPLATRKFAAEFRGMGDYDTVRSIIRTTLRFQTGVAIVLPTIGLFIVETRIAPEHHDYAVLAVLSLLPALLLGVPTALLWTTENLLHNTKASVIGLATNFAGVVMTLALGWDLPGIAGALLAGRTVDLLIRRSYYRRELAQLPGQARRLDPALRRRLVTFCWHQSLLLAIEVVVWNRSEMLFLEHFTDLKEVGYFSMGFNLCQNALLLPGLLAAAAGATMMLKRGAAPEQVPRLAGDTFWVVAIFAVPTLFGLAAVAGPLLSVLYGIRYLPAAFPMTVIAIFSVARALSYPLLEVLFAAEKQGAVLRFSLLMLVVNLGLGLWWIPSAAATGAAFSKGITLLLTTIGLLIIARWKTGLRVPFGRFGRLLACGAIMFAAVRLTVHGLAPLPAMAPLVAGIVVGLICFTLLMRLLRVLSHEDRQGLSSLFDRFRTRPTYHGHRNF